MTKGNEESSDKKVKKDIPIEVISETEESETSNSQELVDELTDLGDKFVRLAQATWESGDRKAIEESLKRAVSTGRVQLQSTLEVKDSLPFVHVMVETVEAAVNAALDVGIVKTTSKPALSVIRGVGQQVDNLSERLESGEPVIINSVQSMADALQGVTIEIAKSDDETQPDSNPEPATA